MPAESVRELLHAMENGEIVATHPEERAIRIDTHSRSDDRNMRRITIAFDPFAQELRSPGCTSCEEGGTEKTDRDEAKNQSVHSSSPVVVSEQRRGSVSE
jgi:hypothetical protein